MPQEALEWVWAILLSSIVIIGLNRIQAVRLFRLENLLLYYTLAILLHFTGILTQKYLGNNYWTYNLYTLLQTGLILYSISQWTQRKVLRMACLSLLAVNMVIFFAEIGPHYPEFHVFADRAILCGGLSMITMLAFYMFELSNTSATALIKSPLFWICSGLLLYFSISDVLLYAAALMEGIKAYYNVIGLVHLIVFILAAALQLVGFLCLPRH